MGHEFEDLFQQMADRAMNKPKYKLPNKSQLKIFWEKRVELISEWSDTFTIIKLWNISSRCTIYRYLRILTRKGLLEKRNTKKKYGSLWRAKKNY